MVDPSKDTLPKEEPTLSKSRETDWPAVLFFIHIHLLSLYGIWLLFFGIKLLTFLLLVALTSVAILGMTTGAHRLWAHQTYQASTGLRIMLMIFQTLAGIGPIYDWVQYHRFHHAHFATDDDPYDYNKGFLYSHFFTRLSKLSPHQEKLKNSIDMSDIEKDSVVMLQKKLYWVLYGILFLLLPLNAPLEYWDDSVLSAIFVIGFLRYLIVLHASWLIESAIGVWGLKPGEKSDSECDQVYTSAKDSDYSAQALRKSTPVTNKRKTTQVKKSCASIRSPPDSNTVFIITKTFWPHYHYLIPYDYKSGEYGTYDCGCSTAFIRVWAALGLATKLRTIETSTIQKALIDSVHTNQDLKVCLKSALSQQKLQEEHYLQRDNFSLS